MKNLSYSELIGKLKEAQKKLFELKLQLAGQQLKNFMQIVDVRRDIARMHTVLADKRVKGDTQEPVLKEEHKAVKEKPKKEAKAEKPTKAKKEKVEKKKAVKEKKSEVVGAKKR